MSLDANASSSTGGLKKSDNVENSSFSRNVSEIQSTLRPTAPEFQTAARSNVSSGAIRKKTLSNNSSNSRRNGSKNNSHYTKYEKNEMENEIYSDRKNFIKNKANRYNKRNESNPNIFHKKALPQYEKQDSCTKYSKQKKLPHFCYPKRNENFNMNIASQGDFRMLQNGSDYINRKRGNVNGKNIKRKDEAVKNASASQRERLEDMIDSHQLECLICCEKIKNSHRIWTCDQCYHILHLTCILSWAKSCTVDLGWRCPACQYVYKDVPNKSKCFCGNTVDPKLEPTLLPHSCGNICLRKGRNCEHKCIILCHPGPCPDCMVMVSKKCYCGKSSSMVKCSLDIEIICENICERYLTCTVHKCENKCHPKQCEPCKKQIIQECYCGSQGRRVTCSMDNKGSKNYSCDEICNKLLSCENHRCQEKCHKGACTPCSYDVTLITTCPCRKTSLNKDRKTCLDPIICCNNICGAILECSQMSDIHTCKSKCHEGLCPPCDRVRKVQCRCGHLYKEVTCQEFISNGCEIKCQRKCTKKRFCGKHKCNQLCCTEIEHFCPLPCNRQLSCGSHRCPLTCHNGRCPPCSETSFEELYCECGFSVLYPPIPCGTKPPSCEKECSRLKSCGHDNYHKCHAGPCPPCTVLCKKWCFGMHEQRSAIPCFQDNISCGLPCGKPLICGRHTCNQPCHSGNCPASCQQPCNEIRPICGHSCNKICHDPPCPKSICKQKVQVTCLCGLQKENKICVEVINDFQIAQLRDNVVELVNGSLLASKQDCVLKILPCSEECLVFERNKRLAIGLQIRNPDLSQKLSPRYSDFLRQFAKKDPHFCQKIHDKLTELVKLSEQSKQRNRSYSFESMNRDKRHFVHEYCKYFGCDSVAYDQEPNRNIVATAIKDKSWIPSMSLLEVLQRENGQRKVPVPNIAHKTSTAKLETTTLNVKIQKKLQTDTLSDSVDYCDYFENPPQKYF